MAGSDDAVVVAPDGTGKSIATRKINVLLDDGTFKTMEVQAVCLVDENGRRIDVLGLAAAVSEILAELKDISLHLKLKGY